jgi:hypothetical protein
VVTRAGLFVVTKIKILSHMLISDDKLIQFLTGQYLWRLYAVFSCRSSGRSRRMFHV